jgi:hypothetical protein
MKRLLQLPKIILYVDGSSLVIGALVVPKEIGVSGTFSAVRGLMMVGEALQEYWGIALGPGDGGCIPNSDPLSCGTVSLWNCMVS